MFKKQYIVIAIIVILAGLTAYFYLTQFYFNQEPEEQKIYTAADFPNALENMTEDVLEESLEDLNKQYKKIQEDSYVYIRWINIGILKKRLVDYAGAEQAWQTAISYNPDQSLAFGNLADLYLFNLGEYEKAEEYYLKVLDMRSDNYTYYIGLVSLYRYNMTEKAHLIEELMIEGARINPGEVGSYYMYLANYFNHGPDNHGGNNKEKARYYTQKTLETNPELKDQLPDL
jgi:tetratricopeptide (TPR) repeat protein|tara:strand:+ start:788 stop:1477 length:690 start_codon:yes stop_codon:yes gene_type:complete